MYLGKYATTEDNIALGKVSDVSVSSQGEVFYLVEKGKDPNTRYYFTQEDVLTSNERVVTVRLESLVTISLNDHISCARFMVWRCVTPLTIELE